MEALKTEERTSYVQDSIPGGLVLENVGPEPVRVDSYTEMDALFESRGLTRREKFSPTPGTSKDPAGVMDSRKYMDPYTLEAGKALILRSSGADAKKAEDAAFVEKLYINRSTHEMSESEAIDRHHQIEEANASRRRS